MTTGLEKLAAWRKENRANVGNSKNYHHIVEFRENRKKSNKEIQKGSKQND